MRYRYKFDQDKLVYFKEEISIISIIKDNYWKGIAGIILALGIWAFSFSNLIDSPKKHILQKRGEVLVEQLGGLNIQFDSITNQLAYIQNRDDNLYRVVSQLKPIPESERKMGFGGINSYQSLEGYASSDLLIESNKRSDILKRQLSLQVKSFNDVFRSVLKLNDSLLSVPAISPVSPYDYHRISSPFGMRVHPITGKVQKHDGIDFAARVGKPIYATGNGIVTRLSKSSKGYGNRISIQHGFGFKTVYAHLNEMDVSLGDTIVRGQKIGTVGNTGTSTGPHLHYEVIYNKKKYNPKNYYMNDLSADEFNSMLKCLCNN